MMLVIKGDHEQWVAACRELMRLAETVENGRDLINALHGEMERGPITDFMVCDQVDHGENLVLHARPGPKMEAFLAELRRAAKDGEDARQH